MKSFIIVISLLVALGVNAQVGLDTQRIIKIWPGVAPGSESWTWQEAQVNTARPNDPLVYNVVSPTLTFFPADPGTANGTAVIICPGGSFCYLHTYTEGSDVARWLAKRGVSSFVLRYRVVHSLTTDPMKERMERMKDPKNAAALVGPLLPLAIADARESIVYVRQHAAELGIAPNRIGIMGFSAGGTLAAASVFNYTVENRPDFVAPIYAYVPPGQLTEVMKDAPPMFIAAATDDELHLVPMSIALYNEWLAAGHSAEIHIYSKGGHGFGMNVQHQPSDSWIDRFGEWLGVQGLLKKR